MKTSVSKDRLIRDCINERKERLIDYDTTIALINWGDKDLA